MKGTFHISLPCINLEDTVSYYKNDLGLTIGRSSSNWVDVNLFGSQLTFVTIEEFKFECPMYLLDKEELPSFHFGVVLNNDEWDDVYDRINRWSIDTIIKRTFFKDKSGEHNSFFVKDPNGYYLEFKTFKLHDEIFM
ncbi:VOC family protein [uncultured Tenacibaculum sp.]|uniref:VOC family protein n=1 Tax=uncultured Tenacibaculum sp. TaxID=174713 RepID=UPI0026139A48|nr:VOC family protein [uncultured Tenacibaculum sp.]